MHLIKSRNIIYLLILIECAAMSLCLSRVVCGEEDDGLRTLFAIQYSAVPSFAALDIDRNGANELVISEGGYIHVYEWHSDRFDEKWKSSRYSYTISSSNRKIRPVFMNFVSPVYPVRYKSGKNINSAFLFFAHPALKKTDYYELTFQKGSYDVQKMLSLPSGLSPYQMCIDNATVFSGQRLNDTSKRLTLYEWNGNEMIEKWQGEQQMGLAIPGELIIMKEGRPKHVVLYTGAKNIIIYCEKGQYQTKAIGKLDTSGIQFNPSDSVIGITRRESLGELWTIETPNSEDALFFKLYVAQFNGTKLTRFEKAKIQGINTDRVSAIAIEDLDNDGIGEIIGSEVEGTLELPKEGEGPELINEISYLFAAKWNGHEYEVMWRRRAADCALQRIAIDNLTTEKQKEIIAEGYSRAKDVYSLFVFKMTE